MERAECDELIRSHIHHLDRRGLARGTITARRHKLIAVDVNIGLRRATTEQLEQFLDARGLAPKSRYDWVSHLSNFYRWAIDFGHHDRDPTAQIVRPKLRRQLPRPMATSDLAVALQMANPTMRAWLSLMAFAGFRCVEVARLEVDDLLWTDDLIRVRGKGDKERMVPMHPDVSRSIHAAGVPTRGRVFRRPRGGPYPAAQISRETSLYLSGLGISATAHQARHWFGTSAYRQSRDLRVVQELLGHSSPGTTATYANWSREEAARTVAALSLDDEPTESLLSDWPSSP